MACDGYSELDQWRSECCKLNMQLGVARCIGQCRIGRCLTTAPDPQPKLIGLAFRKSSRRADTPTLTAAH